MAAGIFSEKIYHNKIFLTGGGKSGVRRLKQHIFELDEEKLHLQREEEEILPIILAICSEI